MKITGPIIPIAKIEWQTVSLILLSYWVWVQLLIYGSNLPPVVWILFSALNITLFMSVTHEVVHGHPTRNNIFNRFLILLPIGWSIPFERFRDTHLHHHKTDELTDPFDDPESWYLCENEWMQRHSIRRIILQFNNTLFGRMLIGPVIGLGRFYASEVAVLINRGTDIRAIGLSWSVHLGLCAVMVAMVLTLSTVPVWQWIAAIYLGHSILLVRTFLEHQAAPDHSERTVIIEAPCPLAFLFLFNNYHFVHHNQPHIPWYRLPQEYRDNRDLYVAENGAYVYRSYWEVFRKFFFRSKEPIAHPFLHQSIKAR